MALENIKRFLYDDHAPHRISHHNLKLQKLNHGIPKTLNTKV